MVFTELAREQSAIDVGKAGMPIVDTVEIVAIGRACGNDDVDGAVASAVDEAPADRGPQLTQGGFFAALVGNEKNIDLIEGLDRLHRHVIGIADADTDDENPAHPSLQGFQRLTPTIRHPLVNRSIRVSDSGSIAKRSA